MSTISTVNVCVVFEIDLQIQNKICVLSLSIKPLTYDCSISE